MEINKEYLEKLWSLFVSKTGPSKKGKKHVNFLGSVKWHKEKFIESANDIEKGVEG